MGAQTQGGRIGRHVRAVHPFEHADAAAHVARQAGVMVGNFRAHPHACAARVAGRGAAEGEGRAGRDVSECAGNEEAIGKGMGTTLVTGAAGEGPARELREEAGEGWLGDAVSKVGGRGR